MDRLTIKVSSANLRPGMIGQGWKGDYQIVEAALQTRTLGGWKVRWRWLEPEPGDIEELHYDIGTEGHWTIYQDSARLVIQEDPW